MLLLIFVEDSKYKKKLHNCLDFGAEFHLLVNVK